MNDQHKRLIAGRAMTIFERIENPDAVAGNRPVAEVDELMAEWEAHYPNRAEFERRLARDGLDVAVCREAINTDRLAIDEPVPEWVDELERLLETVEEFSLESPPPEHDVEKGTLSVNVDDWLFPEVSAAVAEHARRALPDTFASSTVSPAAVDRLGISLREEVQSLFSRALFVEFKSFVASDDEALAKADPSAFDHPPTDRYNEFVEYLFAGGFRDFCQQYPMFARNLMTTVRQWRERLVEFGSRLRADRSGLTERFGVDPEATVSVIEPLADDTHGDGRAVLRVEFESGEKLVYKPRDVEAGVTFHRVLSRLDEHLPTPDFRTPAYLSCGTHGWMEVVEHEGCSDAAAVERYYRRAGALICVTYLLGIHDCQVENLVVAGEHPLLVDCETTCHHYMDVGRQPKQVGFAALRDDSVLLTALLPTGTDGVSMHDRKADIGAKMAGISSSSASTELENTLVPDVRAANTDVMDVDHVPAPIDRAESVPHVDGEDQPPEAYLDQILEGFEQSYDALLRLRDDGTLSDLGFPSAFEGVETRFIFRPTFVYGSVLRECRSRECLADGVRYGVEMERLAVPHHDGEVIADDTWSFYALERRALRRLDPPRFTGGPNDESIRFEGEAIGVEVDRTGMEVAVHRIRNASVEDKREQLEYIRGAFGAKPATDRGEVSIRDFSNVDVPTDSRILDEAEAQFDRIEAAATEGVDGSYYWASVAQFEGTDRLTLQPSDGSLYHGRTGIALSGAALYRITGDDQYRRFVDRTLRPLRRTLRSDRYGDPSDRDGESPHQQFSPPELTAGLHQHGGVAGLGAVIYGLAAVGSLVNDTSLYADAERAAAYITDDSIANDETYDVNGGLAGTVLGLLALYDRTGEEALVEASVRCGDRLLTERVTSPWGERGWNTLGTEQLTTGFAHGQAGIAYALARLGAVSGSERYLDAAEEALAYENRFFDADRNNWREVREWTSTEFFDQWCYGRTGIGLARLGTLAHAPSERVRRDVDRALDGLDSSHLGEYDHLCCGTAGRVQFLLEANRRTSRSCSEPARLLGRMIDRKESTGAYPTATHSTRIPGPTLFNGRAGLVYTMSRTIEPEDIPCVLLWE